MLDEKLKEEFKGEEEKQLGAGKQYNETVASSEVGGCWGTFLEQPAGWGHNARALCVAAAHRQRCRACVHAQQHCPTMNASLLLAADLPLPDPLECRMLQATPTAGVCLPTHPQGTRETVVIISSGKKKGTNATATAAAAGDAAAGGATHTDAAHGDAAMGGAAAGLPTGGGGGGGGGGVSEAAAAHAAYETASVAADEEAKVQAKHDKQKELEEQIEAASEADVDRIIDSKDNEYVLSKPSE